MVILKGYANFGINILPIITLLRPTNEREEYFLTTRIMYSTLVVMLEFIVSIIKLMSLYCHYYCNYHSSQIKLFRKARIRITSKSIKVFESRHCLPTFGEILISFFFQRPRDSKRNFQYMALGQGWTFSTHKVITNRQTF